MFKDLKGINKEREERDRKHTVDRLQEICEAFLKKPEIKSPWEKDANYEEFFGKWGNLPMTDRYYTLLQLGLDKIIFDEKDLRSFIYANANKDLNGDDSRNLGVFSGLLLHLLTERNKEKNKRTVFCIDGQGNQFDRLLQYTPNADILVVQNFKGEGICDAVGTAGKAKILIARNIEGDFTLNDAGMLSGEIGLIIAKDLAGEFILNDISGHEGKTDLVIADNIKGDDVFYYAAKEKGRINTAYTRGIAPYEFSLRQAKDNGIQKFICANKQPHVYAKETITKQENPAQYQRLVREHKINEMLYLVDSLEGKDEQEMAKIALKIDRVYETTKNV